MPIIDMQRRLRECGRIRIGEQIPTSSGKTRPSKLSTFRLTSSDQTVIEAAAALFGGEARAWLGQYEVITTTDRLEVVVPPTGMAFSQYYETWLQGGCQRRCDGERASVVDGRPADVPCVCDPDERACKPHTRLSVMLPDLPAVGLWRLDTQGYYAAEELAGAVDLALAFAQQGTYLPAELRLEQREKRRPGEPTKKFAVPVLDLKVSVRNLGFTTPAASLPFTPVPVAELPAPPTATVGTQLDVAPRERRSSQVPIPPTGIRVRPGVLPETVADHDIIDVPPLNAHPDRPVPPYGSPERAAIDSPPPDEPAIRPAVWADEMPPTEPDIGDDVPRLFSPNPRAVIACKEALLTDSERHALVSDITGGRTESSNDLTSAELHTLQQRTLKIRVEALGEFGRRSWKESGLRQISRLTQADMRGAQDFVAHLEQLNRESF